jgi:hypothetical protein
MDRISVWDLAKSFESEAIIKSTFDSVPKVPGETARYIFTEPAFRSFDYAINFAFVIKVGTTEYVSHKAIAFDRVVHLNKWEHVHEKMDELYEDMKSQLKADGLLYYEKRTEPEKLPDWLVRP